MGDENYRTVSLTESAYRRLEARKRPNESFSETIERLAGERSLREIAGLVSDGEAAEMRSAMREQNERTRSRLDRVVDEIDS